MISKKMVEEILLEVEASCQEDDLTKIINEFCSDETNDIKYLFEYYNYYDSLTLYKYSQSAYAEWIYDVCEGYENSIDQLMDCYTMIRDYARSHYIDYYIEDDIVNFVNVSKFRKALYNNKALLNKVINCIYTNVRNYANNEYLVNEYNLNKELYRELLKIKKETKEEQK